MAPPTQKPNAPAKPGTPPANFAAQPPAAKVMLGVMAVALLGAIFYFALYSPIEDELASANQQRATLTQERAQAEEQQREYLRLREQLAAREGLDRSNMRVLPEQAEMASFLQDLNRLAETSGLAIRTVEPRPEEPAEHYVRLPVQLLVAGRYHQLARFFYNVSRLERAISMENIRLGSPTTVGEDVVLQVQVLATTYRRPSAEEAEALGQAEQGT